MLLRLIRVYNLSDLLNNDSLLTVDPGKTLYYCYSMLFVSLSLIWDNWVGIKGIALQWFSSYLKIRTFSVDLSKFFSSSAPIVSCVPQGSILSPLFLIFLLEVLLGNIILLFGFFADNTKLYLPSKTVDSIQSSLDCFEDSLGYQITVSSSIMTKLK